MRPSLALSTLLALLLLAACGQKGDLYLPDQKQSAPRSMTQTP